MYHKRRLDKELHLSLPEGEKDHLLIRIAAGEESHPRADLLRRFSEANPAPRPEPAARRTVVELIAAAARRSEERNRRRAEREKRDRKRREREDARVRERRLNELAAREDWTWHRVDELIAERKPAAYEEAVPLFSDLWELARRGGRTCAVEERIRALRVEHARKARFLDRLDRAGTPGRRP